MTAAPVSVIVVSRHRPETLLRCLAGIEQLDHALFEVVVVADPGGLARLRAAGFDGIREVPFDTPNISAARNQGIWAAGGEILAFIDDDAVPEPTWLSRLAAPFEDPGVAAAGGYVIGRNGISFQHTARSIDAEGRHRPLDLEGTAPRVIAGRTGRGIKTEGTNCAFRAGVLRAMGGFDPAFRFYLDESDVNLRLAGDGARTALVPLAQVHHGFAASERRHASRMPRSLFEVAASQAVFLRKHAAEGRRAPAMAVLRDEQRQRLLRYMVAGDCEPRDVGRLLMDFDAGAVEGQGRRIAPLPPIPQTAAFDPFRPRRRYHAARTLAGRPWQARHLRRAAAEAASDGARTSLYLFSPTALYHSVRFRAEGYWEQRGGLLGRSRRDDPLLRLQDFATRLRREVDRVASVRNVP
jgi:GT2 family glycosyltransferase